MNILPPSGVGFLHHAPQGKRMELYSVAISDKVVSSEERSQRVVSYYRDQDTTTEHWHACLAKYRAVYFPLYHNVSSRKYHISSSLCAPDPDGNYIFN